MTKIFIIHGVYGSPEENWIPWLKSELEDLGCEVFAPKFPTPEGHNLENWLSILKDYEVDEDTILVGHSMACAFVLSVLEKLDKPVKACFFVAGWTGLLNDPLDELNKTFVDRNFDWEKIKQNCKKFVLFSSDNDPYVSLDLGKKLASDVGGELTVVKGAGHFNAKAGYLKFDLLLDKIKEEL